MTDARATDARAGDLPRPAERLASSVPASSVARHRLGDAWAAVAGWEGDVERAWRELAAAWPASAGTRDAIRWLAVEARRLVDGPQCAVARAVRAQRVPWRLDEGPLHALGARAQRFLDDARSRLAALAAQRALQERLRRLQAAWEPTFPRAWERWTALLAVDDARIDCAASTAELTALAARVDEVEARLAEWRRDVLGWLAEVGEAAPAAPGHDGSGGWAPLEARYHALLSVGAADRTALLARSAALLRAGAVDQIAGLRRRQPSAPRGLAVRLAEQWAEHAADAVVGLEESSAYLAALRELYGYRIARLGEPR